MNLGTALRRWPSTPRFALVAAVIVALLIGHALARLPLGWVDRLEYALHDLQISILSPGRPDPRIVMVDVDELALAEQGRWPWRRGRVADLLEAIVEREGAALVGLDLVLAEPDHSSGLAELQRLAAPGGALAGQPGFSETLATLRPVLDDDARLAATLARLPVVMGFHLSSERSARSIGALPPGALSPADTQRLLPALRAWPGHGGNLAQLQQAARHGGGFLNGQIDNDGQVRRMPLLARHDGAIYTTLSVAMLRQLLGSADRSADISLEPDSGPLRALRIAGERGLRLVRVNEQAEAVVPFRNSEQPFARLSAADVLAGRLPADALRGKLVLVGVSAPGLIDQRTTPVDGAMPGTLVHAHLLSGLLDGRLVATPHEARAAQALLLLLLGALMVLLLPRLSLAGAIGLAVALELGLLALHAATWRYAHQALPLADALLLPPLLLLLHLLLALRAATGARQRLKALFGQYVPPELVEEMSLEPERHTMHSRSTELSVMFADVRGFTGLAERMPPTELSAMMNHIFSHLTDIIRAHRGTLDKYIGDAVMAFWGAPLDDPQHARHAVDAALAMRAALPALQDELARHGWPRLDLSIGVDSGPMVVGDMGSRHRLAYTVLGDAVNRAARIQGLAAENGLGLLVGEATQRALAGQRLCLPIGPVQLRGRDAPLQIWKPLPLTPGEDPAADRRAAGLIALHAADAAGHREAARALLAALLAEWPDDPQIQRICAWIARRWEGRAPAPPLSA